MPNDPTQTPTPTPPHLPGHDPETMSAPVTVKHPHTGEIVETTNAEVAKYRVQGFQQVPKPESPPLAAVPPLTAADTSHHPISHPTEEKES